MTLTFKLVLDIVKLNQHTIYLDQRSFSSKVVVLTHICTQTDCCIWTIKIVGNEVCCFCLDCLRRVLAEDVFAAEPLPPFPASVKDGYAVIGNSLCIVYLYILHFFGQRFSLCKFFVTL